MRRSPLLLGALVPLVWALLGQGSDALGDEQELTFARALLDRGWTVVAEGVIERALAAAPPADRERFRVLKGQLLLREAQRAGGARARAEAFQKAFVLVEELASSSGKAPVAGPASADLGELLISASAAAAEEARRENEAARAADLRKQALRLVDAAEKVFQARLDAAQKASAQAPGGEEDEEGLTGASREEMDAAYSLARVHYARAMAMDQKADREAALRRAIRELDDFQATYAQTLLCYQAAILAGQCWSELEDHRRAMSVFDGAAGLTELFKDDAGRVRIDHPAAADIVQRALYLKAQAANRAGRPADAQAAVALALRLFPGVRSAPIGLALRIEGAEAYSRQQKYKEAGRRLQEVVNDDRDGPGGAAARQVLTTILGKVELEAEGATQAAIVGFLERGDTSGAIRVSRQVLARLDSSPERKAAEAPSLLLLLGKAYSQAQRHREAAIVFEELVERYPDHKLAAEAAFESVKSRLLSHAKAPSKLERDRYEKNLSRLTGKYGKSPQAAAGKFLEGEEAMEAGKFLEAADRYLEVPETASHYRDSALYQAGLAVYRHAEGVKSARERKAHYDRAEKLFEECLQLATREEPNLDPERVQKRKKLRLAARLRLAELYSSSTVKSYQKALEMIQAVEREDEPSPTEKGSLYQSRVKTLAALGRIEDAVQSFKALREAYPNLRALPYLCQEIALAYDGEAVVARDQGGKKAREEYRLRSARALEYYAAWVEESRRLRVPVPHRMAVKTADRALAIALEVSGLPERKDSFTDALGRSDLPRTEWQRAVMLLEEARPKKRGLENTDWLPLAKLGRAYGFLGEWAKARTALDEALVWGGLLAATGETSPQPRFEALEGAPDLLDIFIDLGFAELIPATKGALTRAQAIFERAFERTERESCAWWKCRYGYLAAVIKEGKYQEADGGLQVIRQAFPQWDGGRCGLQAEFEALKKELEKRK